MKSDALGPIGAGATMRLGRPIGTGTDEVSPDDLFEAYYRGFPLILSRRQFEAVDA